MSKILIVSDIHIHDYPQRNPSDKYRLYQSRTVCNNIVEVAKKEGCERIILAGDIIEKSIIRPYIQAEVKLFLDTLMKNFKEGYIIWGNHDQDNKSSDQHFNDSCLSVMLPSNLYYADKKILNIDNISIAFSNWRPEFDLEFIKEKVDLLVTHATINYGGGDVIKSQKLDESKFDLCISGDIHRPGTVGKYVSIGIPQKCKMGDFDEQTGIIIDCSTKGWNYVDLNPHKNLMKFEWTGDLKEEGWDEETMTWKAYRREVTSFNDAETDIKIPQWEEIDHLVGKIIKENGLESIHKEVLSQIKDISKNEVDFGFILQRLECSNWRSIEHVELWFDNRDKILITGKNGSGKSSLLSALKYAFVENRSLKDFVQFGSKGCSTEVDFVYQGNLYRILRGYDMTKKRSIYGLWVWNSDVFQPMKYNNKKEFEEDLLIRFPFIQYIDDVMFFDPDHNKLLADISKKEIDADIISKFFKLDKIDTLNEQAISILDYKTKDVVELEEKLKVATINLERVKEDLARIPIPPVSLENLRLQKQEGEEIAKKSKAWTDWVIRNSNLQATRSFQESELQRYKSDRLNCRPIEDIEKDASELRNLIDDISLVKIPELKKIETEIKYLRMERESIRKKGYELHQQRSELGKTKLCPTCGKPMEKQVDLESTKLDMDWKLKELEQKMRECDEKIALKEAENTDVPFKMQSYQEQYNTLQHRLNDISQEKNNIERLDRDIITCERKLESVLQEINSNPAPPVQELPPNYYEIMSGINSGIMAWEEIERLEADKQAWMGEIALEDNKLTAIKDQVLNLETYIKLTSGTGKIFEEIMNRLAEDFTDNYVQYKVYSGKERKKDKLKLLSSFNVEGNWVSYENCSSGQKTILDVHYLSKIITNMGFLIMDEFLKHLDPKNHDICIDMISQFNVSCVMLSSHMESVSNFHNKTCTLELNDSGITKIKLE